MSEGESFWKTLPGILTGLAGLVGAVAALTTALYTAGIIGGGGKGPPHPPGDAARTEIRRISTTGVSERLLRVTVDYAYAGDLGLDVAGVLLTPAGSSGALAPGLAVSTARVPKGSGSFAIDLRADRPGTYAIESVEVCLLGAPVDGRSRRTCRTFPLRWSLTGPEQPAHRRDAVWNLRAVEPAGSSLLVTVDYSYAGQFGTDPRSVYLAAAARMQGGRQVPDTGFERATGSADVQAGSGTSSVLIRKYRHGAYKSVDVRVCLMARRPPQEIACQVFPYPKSWP
jgi:hypothetical protein